MIPTNKPVQNPIHIKQEKKSWNIGNLEIKKERTSLKIRPCLIIKAIPNAAKNSVIILEEPKRIRRAYEQI